MSYEGEQDDIVESASEIERLKRELAEARKEIEKHETQIAAYQKNEIKLNNLRNEASGGEQEAVEFAQDTGDENVRLLHQLAEARAEVDRMHDLPPGEGLMQQAREWKDRAEKAERELTKAKVDIRNHEDVLEVYVKTLSKALVRARFNADIAETAERERDVLYRLLVEDTPISVHRIQEVLDADRAGEGVADGLHDSHE